MLPNEQNEITVTLQSQ